MTTRLKHARDVPLVRTTMESNKNVLYVHLVPAQKLKEQKIKRIVTVS